MEERSMIREDLIEQVNSLGNAILESPEYRNLIQCDEELEKDQEAMDLLHRFRLKQQELQMKGFDRGILDELDKLEMQLKNNETVARLESSQKELAGLFKDSNDLISEKIGQQFAQKRGGCF